MAITVDELNIQIVADYEAATKAIDKLEQRLSKLMTAYSKLTSTGKKATTTFSKINSVIGKTTNTMNKNQTAINNSKSSFSKFTDKISQQISKWRTLHGAFKSVANTFASWYKESNDYIETLNLFTITMGDATKEAYAFAESVQTLVGIDVADWMKYQGTFKQLAAGYGVADDAANKMSKNLTQLSYDLASFFNTDVETAFDKLSSAMSGQVKGLREFGIDTTVASLQQYALSKGIETSVRSMTQAEKSILRYNYIMEHSIKVQGDMARTLVTPANALRVLSALMTQFKRALGNIVSVLVTQFIPYVQAMVSVLTEAANAIAAFFNFELPVIDYSNLGSNGLSSVLEDAEESADGVSDSIKKIKKQLMGFDELNIISNPDTGSGGSAADTGLGGDLGMDLFEYDFLKDLDTSKLDEIKEKMKDILWYSGAIVAAFAGWKLTGMLVGLAKAIKSAGGLKKALGKVTASASELTTLLGGAMIAGGLVIYIKGFVTAWGKGLNAESIVELLGGSAAMIAGGALVGKYIGTALGNSMMGTLVGGGIFAALAGGGIFFTGIKDALTNGIDWLSAIIIPLGSTMAGAGIGAIIGSMGGPIGTGLGALIGLAVGLITDFSVWVYQNWDSITAWFSQGLDNIGQFFTNTWNWITSVWSVAATWFDTTIIQPVVGFFVGLWTSISTTASDCWNAIVAFFTPAFNWFSQLFGSIKQTISDVFYNIGVIAKGCWDIIKAVWEKVSQWFDTNIGQPVARIFNNLWTVVKSAASSAWNGIKTTFSVIGTWVNTNIVQPVSKLFSSLWSDFKSGATSAWNGVKEVFGKVGTFFKDTFSNAWAGIVKVFNTGGEIFKNIKDGVTSAFKSVVNGLIKGINNVIANPFNAINNALTTIKNITVAGIQPFKNLKTISVPSIPLLASGGMVDVGQMFIAREAGPELVGTIGNKSAVANNDQIISGIEAGVYRAMMAANGNGSKPVQITVVTDIDGEVVARKFVNYHNDVVVQTGESPLFV